MIDLSKAIKSFENDAAKQWLYENRKVETLLVAARRWDALTSPETIEALKDLDSIVSLILHRHTVVPPLPTEEYARLLSAVAQVRVLLRAVAGVEE